MTDIPAKKLPKPGVPIWVYAIGLGAVLLWDFLQLPGEMKEIGPQLAAHNQARAYGYLAGASFFPAVIVAVATYFLFLRKRGGSPAYFVSLLVVPYLLQVWFLSSVVSAGEARRAVDKADAQTAVTEIRSAMNAAMNRQSTPQSIDTRAKAGGTQGAMEGQMKQVVAQAIADRNGYQAEIKALGFPDFLQPSRLRTPAERAAAHAKLKKARLIVAKYRDLMLAHLRQEREQAQHLNAPAQIRDNFVHGIDEAVAQDMPDVTRLWTLEAATLDEIDAEVTLLSKADGHWVDSGGGVTLFSRRSDLKAYQAHQDRIRAYVDEQNRLKQTMRDRMERSMKKMEQDAAQP